MKYPVILTTNTRKETLKRRRTDGGLPLRDCGYIRMMVDAFDILRVMEVQKDEGDHDTPLCEVKYALENLVTVKDEEVARDVATIIVRHDLDTIHARIEDAKREKKEWEE